MYYYNKVYRNCISCSGTGSQETYQHNTRYDSISRTYQTVRQRVIKRCYQCSGNGKVVDEFATRINQRRQEQIKQQKRKQQKRKQQKRKQQEEKRKQEQKKRIQAQKKQAQFKQFTLKQKIWEQYVDNYNKEITQPLLGQNNYQKVQEKSTNFKLEGKKFWQNNENNEESYVVCGYCDGKGYDLMNMSQKCRGCEDQGKDQLRTRQLCKSPLMIITYLLILNQ